MMSIENELRLIQNRVNYVHEYTTKRVMQEFKESHPELSWFVDKEDRVEHHGWGDDVAVTDSDKEEAIKDYAKALITFQAWLAERQLFLDYMSSLKRDADDCSSVLEALPSIEKGIKEGLLKNIGDDLHAICKVGVGYVDVYSEETEDPIRFIDQGGDIYMMYVPLSNVDEDEIKMSVSDIAEHAVRVLIKIYKDQNNVN